MCKVGSVWKCVFIISGGNFVLRPFNLQIHYNCKIAQKQKLLTSNQRTSCLLPKTPDNWLLAVPYFPVVTQVRGLHCWCQIYHQHYFSYTGTLFSCKGTQKHIFITRWKQPVEYTWLLLRWRWLWRVNVIWAPLQWQTFQLTVSIPSSLWQLFFMLYCNEAQP